MNAINVKMMMYSIVLKTCTVQGRRGKWQQAYSTKAFNSFYVEVHTYLVWIGMMHTEVSIVIIIDTDGYVMNK